MDFTNAFYIKLGRGGQWASGSLEHGLMRFGWDEVDLALVNERDWVGIERQVREDADRRGTRHGVATRDLLAFRKIVSSSSADIWITFHQGRLWWTRLDEGPMLLDGISKFRRTSRPWSDRAETGIVLSSAELLGALAAIQAFRGTVCSVKNASQLKRVLSGTPSPLATRIVGASENLAARVGEAICELHWRDFEVLVDLVFRQSGWRRISMLGGGMDYADLELLDTITGARYVVQIKSTATAAELTSYIPATLPLGLARLYFVVHSPDPSVRSMVLPPGVEFIEPGKLADMVVTAGLHGWVADKVR